jgi:hypothetical protein
MIPFLFWKISKIPIVTTNLILYWDAGNPSSYPGSGTAIEDLTSSNYDGILNGPTYSSADGGKFVHVKASNHWINSTGSNSGDGIVNTSDYTIEIWANPTNTNQSAWLFGNRNGQAGPQLSIVLGTAVDGGTITASKKIGLIYISTNTLTGRVFSTANDIIDGNWKHLVMTRVGLTLKLYVNTVEQSLNTGQQIGTALDITNTLTWRVGDNGNGNGLFAIDGATAINRLYKDKALTLAEVQQNFNAEKARFGL